MYEAGGVGLEGLMSGVSGAHRHVEAPVLFVGKAGLELPCTFYLRPNRCLSRLGRFV